VTKTPPMLPPPAEPTPLSFGAKPSSPVGTHR
jgi:hypothetical protein